MDTDFLRNDGCIVVNKRLARAIGLDAAIMYSELVSKYAYFKERDETTEDGFFFNTTQNMQEDSCLSGYQQRKALKLLRDKGWIRQENRGIPQKRYFNVAAGAKLVEQYLETLPKVHKSKDSSDNSKISRHPVGEKLQGNKNKRTIPKNKTNAYIIGDDAHVDLFLKCYEYVMNKPHRRIFDYHEIEKLDLMSMYELDELEEVILEHLYEHRHDPNKCTLNYFCRAIDRYR